MMREYSRLVLAGVRGGSGKTTISLATIAALRSRGLKVVPYKKGPDYIDAGWMSLAAGNPCYNLDPFLIPRDRVRESFISHFNGDIAVIEGNRGLYDGMDDEGSYSTAELSKLLRSPVILIVDCTKMTRTAAAVVLGCLHLDKEVNIKGVVLNQVAGARHEAVARASIERHCSVPVLGAVPRFGSGELPERHMGLTPHQEHSDTDRVIELMERVGRDYIDIDGMLRVATGAGPLEDIIQDTGYRSEESGIRSQESVVRIGVVRDSAFQFYYPENLEELERKGAELVEINALEAAGMPDIDALYIGGGFPETQALLLADNGSFRSAVRSAAEEGLPIYAECGGLMFLGQSITVKGLRYPMVDLLPLTFEMEAKPQAHGYTIVEVDRENPFYPPGTILHGHEFHYSSVAGIGSADGVYTAFKMKRGKGIYKGRDGVCYKNVFATYTHLHALGAPEWVDGLMERAREFKGVNRQTA